MNDYEVEGDSWTAGTYRVCATLLPSPVFIACIYKYILHKWCNLDLDYTPNMAKSMWTPDTIHHSIHFLYAYPT